MNINLTKSSTEGIKSRLDIMLEHADGQTDVLYSQDFTKKADDYLEFLSEDDKEKALSLLNDGSGPYPYYHETHDFNENPFDENGYCRHGLTWMTCPCGCGEY